VSGGDSDDIVSWNDSDDGAAFDDDPPEIAGDTALDTWHGLLTSYLDIRNVGLSDTGEAYPETTAGDVHRISMLLSRELCMPRYDFANLATTRAAWRDAVVRTSMLCDRVAWRDPYPENERFWLSDSLALAQRLAVVDTRRSAIVDDHHGLIRVRGDRADALTTWNDLRNFLLQRRPVRTDQQSHRYPDATVGDVVQVAQFLNEDLHRTTALIGDRAVPIHWQFEVRRWRQALARVVDTARGHKFDETYADNERFWRDSRRFAIRMSVYRDLLTPQLRSET
jgi:hypothetical protein